MGGGSAMTRWKPPQKAKRDANEPDIVKALEALGVLVERIDKPVDLLCKYRGRVYLAEVKGEGVKRRKSQVAQNEFIDLWEVPILRTVHDVIEIVAEWGGEVSIPYRGQIS